MKKIILLLSLVLSLTNANDIYFNRAFENGRIGNIEEAIYWYSQSYKVYGNNESKNILLGAYSKNSNLGISEYLKEQYQYAINNFSIAENIMDRLMQIEKKHNQIYMKDYAFVLKFYAIALDELGNAEEAMNKFNKALTISKKYVTDKNIEAGIYLEMENTLSNQGKYNEAKQLLADLDMDAITEPFWKASALKSYAYLLLETGDMDSAIVYLEKSLKICKKNLKFEKQAYAKLIADIYHLMGKSIAKKEILNKRNKNKNIDKNVLKKAFNFYTKSLEYIEKIPKNREYYNMLSNNYLDIAIYYRNIGNLKQDEIYLKKLENLLNQFPLLASNRLKNNLYYNFALLYYELGNLKLASKYLEKEEHTAVDNLALYHKLKADIKCKKIGCTE